MTEDTVTLLREQVQVATGWLSQMGTLVAPPVWERCSRATKKLRRGSTAFKVEFARVLALAQYRQPAKPPRQISTGRALRCAVRRAWRCWLRRDRSRRPTLRLALRAIYAQTLLWSGRAWPFADSSSRVARSSAIAQAYLGAFEKEIERRYRYDLPPLPWTPEQRERARKWLRRIGPWWIGGWWGMVTCAMGRPTQADC